MTNRESVKELVTKLRLRSVIYGVLVLVPWSFLLLYSMFSSHSTAKNHGDPPFNIPPASVNNSKVSTTSLVEINKVQQVAFRIYVFTMDRPASLRRLLTSLNEANYNGDKVELYILVDRLKRKNACHKDVMRLSQDWLWPHGPKVVYCHPDKVGLFGQWIFSWRPRLNDRLRVVFFEDDCHVSPRFYAWLNLAHQVYASRNDVIGISLQRPSIRARKGKTKSHFGLKIPLLDRYGRRSHAFLYKLVGTWGFSPINGAWRQFQQWYMAQTGDPGPYPISLRTRESYKPSSSRDGGILDDNDHNIIGLEKFNSGNSSDDTTTHDPDATQESSDQHPSHRFYPYVDDLITTDWYKSQHGKGTMWTQYFIYYCDLHNLYTVYSALKDNKTLSANHRERGLHYEKSKAQDFERLDRDDVEYEVDFLMSSDPVLLDWDGSCQ